MYLAKQSIAVFKKELSSEFKTRSSLSAVALFILTTVTISALAIAGQHPSTEVYSGLLWIIMFFSAMTGLSKVFVSESERGTSFILQLTVQSSSVYFGKLLYNTILSLAINLFSVLLYLVFINSNSIAMPLEFALVTTLAALGLSASTTIISALISRAGSKNSLFAVLSFPIVLPLIILGLDLTIAAFSGSDENWINGFLQLIAYSGILIVLSYMLFDFVWED